MNKTHALTGLIGLCLGIWLGTMIGFSSGTSTSSPADKNPEGPGENHTASTSQKSEIERLHRENDDLRRQLQAQAPTQDAPKTSGTDFPIPRKFVEQLGFRPWDEYENKISPELIELLHITPAEQEILKPVIMTARSQLKQLEDSHTSLTSQTPTQVVISVGQFAQEGGAIRDDLEQQIYDALGSDRGELFMGFVDKGGYEFSDSFGTDTKKVTVTMQPDGKYEVRTNVDKNGANGSGGSYSSSMTSTVLPVEYAPYFSTKN